jgi:hypothetical protein
MDLQKLEDGWKIVGLHSSTEEMDRERWAFG